MRTHSLSASAVLLIFSILLIGLPLFGQTTVSGRLLDADTNQPIPYANIGVPEKAVGTVSDDNGHFALSGISVTDEIVFSSIGYATLRLRAEEVGEDASISLEPKAYNIDQIDIQASKINGAEKRFGVRNKTRSLSIGFGNTQLGTEIGTPIRIKRPVYVKTANFVLNHAKGDSLLFRVNIYQFENGVVGEHLLTENIYIEEKQRKGLISIDVSAYNIILESDVLLTLEWLRNYDEIGNKEITFDTKKAGNPRGIFTRWTKGNAFEVLSFNQGRNLCFYLMGVEI